MLKITGLSLLLGAAALIVVLTQFFAPPTSGTPEPPTIVLSEDAASFKKSRGTFSEDGVKLAPDRARAIVKLDTGGIEAAHYPFLHIALKNPTRSLKVMISFEADGKRSDDYTLEATSPTSVWLATNEFQGWKGSIEAVELTFIAPGRESVHIADLSLHPASSTRQLRAIVSDLSSFKPWKRAQMNTHTGVAKVASFYPVPLVMTWLLLSLSIYGLIVLFTRRAFNWTEVGLIFLACWVSLDLVWQKRLTHQVTHSFQTFSGKTSEEKLAAGPDGKLYRFISTVKQHIESPDARVFVASSDLYRGMRGAYYLYPLNPYWKLEGPQIPDGRFMREGDYVLLLAPTRVKLNRAEGIRLPETGYFPVETLLFSPTGRLVRLE
jgi:hypothetical protein